MNIRNIGTILTVALLAGAQATLVFAQDTPRVEELKKQKAEAEAEEQYYKSIAARDKARWEAVGLPSFKGETTLNQGAGKMEALQLTTGVLMLAAEAIAFDAKAATRGSATPPDTVVKESPGGKIAVLAGTEALAFDIAATIEIQIESLEHDLVLVRQIAKVEKQPSKPAISGVVETLAESGIGPAFNAIAGLLRTETTVDSVDLTEIDDKMLATAVARHLAGRAILPSAALSPSLAKSPIATRVIRLLKAAEELGRDRKKLGGNPGDEAKAGIEAIDGWLKAFADFYKSIATADPQGVTLLGKAARAEALRTSAAYVLRVYLNKGGGSLITYKNIGTFLGGDPIRVSGGLVASYTVTDPGNGLVKGAGVVLCRTALTKLRKIHKGDFPVAKVSGNKVMKSNWGVCEAQFDAPPPTPDRKPSAR